MYFTKRYNIQIKDLDNKEYGNILQSIMKGYYSNAIQSTKLSSKFTYRRSAVLL